MRKYFDNNDHGYLPASAFKDVDPNGDVFRCQRCDRVFPLSEMVLQDGQRVCRSWCADIMDKTTIMEQLAKEQSVVDSYAPQIYPVASPCGDAVGVTAWSARPFVVPYGGSATLALTGVNLSSADVISTTMASPTITATYPSTTQANVLIDITAGGSAARGTYSFTYAGVTYRNSIIVR